MSDIEILHSKINDRFSHSLQSIKIENDELTIELAPNQLITVATSLRDDADLAFNLLVDVCGVDYLHYGLSEWETNSATATGFERGVDLTQIKNANLNDRPRFAVVYHLLSTIHNHRIRLRVFLVENASPLIDSVFEIWPSANWYEREAFDLFGIRFNGHPDLRRILTDYGFIGHPFRKDFPLIGEVEVRYDENQKRVVYQPVSITPRILEPKVIRDDTRYLAGE